MSDVPRAGDTPIAMSYGFFLSAALSRLGILPFWLFVTGICFLATGLYLGNRRRRLQEEANLYD